MKIQRRFRPIDINDTCQLYIPFYKYGLENGSHVHDHSPAHNDGTRYGATPAGIGWQYDGDDNVDLGGTALEFSKADSWSAITWFNADVVDSWDTLIGKYTDTGEKGWDLRILTSNLHARLKSGAGQVLQALGGTTLVVGRWYCGAMTYNGGQGAGDLLVYLNGAKDGESDAGGLVGDIIAGVNAYVGSHATGGYFYGEIGEVFVCSGVLSPQQIQNFYERTRKRYEV